jgi:hypothetical protein
MEVCWLTPEEQLLKAAPPSTACFSPPVKSLSYFSRNQPQFGFYKSQSPLWRCQLAQESAELFTVLA